MLAISRGCAVRAAQRLRDDVVDDAELLEILRGQRRASAASGLVSSVATFHRMPAQPSGLMTE